MATRTLSALGSNATDALFRIWVAEIHAALTAFGWVQATGVGTQIDPVTVSRPAAVDTYQGYSVWKMNDSLQATAAVFMRLDFGTGQATNIPAMKCQVAIGGCDSSGNLTGIIGTQQTMRSNVAIIGTNTNIRTSGTSSSFRFHWAVGTTGAVPLVIVVQRDCDTSGVETAFGVNMALAWHSSYRSQFIEAPSGNLGVVETILYALISSQTTQTGSSNTGVGAVRIPLGPFRNPMISLLLCSRGDFSDQTTNTVTIYGASHTYMMFTAGTGNAANSLNATCGFCLLWE